MPSRFFTPQLPLFIIAFIAAIMILGLTLTVLWAGFLRGLPGVDAVYSLENFKVIFGKPVLISGVKNTFIVAIGTVLVNLFFALPIAWLVQRTNVSFKRLWMVLMFLPLVMPKLHQDIIELLKF